MREMNITNIVDVLIVLVILLCAVSGFKRGGIKQTISTVGFLIVLVVAFSLKNPVAEFLSLHLPFFNFSGTFEGVTALNIIIYQLIAFFLMVILLEAVLNVVISMSGIVEKLIRMTIILSLPSKILGCIVGAIEGFLIVFIALLVLKQPMFHLTVFEGSELTDKVLTSTPVLSNFADSIVSTVTDVYDISIEYKEAANAEELNKRTVETMLKHKLITPDYVRKLIDAGKIEILGIDAILNQYD